VLRAALAGAKALAQGVDALVAGGQEALEVELGRGPQVAAGGRDGLDVELGRRRADQDRRLDLDEAAEAKEAAGAKQELAARGQGIAAGAYAVS
jgi:hypothetical protein